MSTAISTFWAILTLVVNLQLAIYILTGCSYVESWKKTGKTILWLFALSEPGAARRLSISAITLFFCGCALYLALSYFASVA